MQDKDQNSPAPSVSRKKRNLTPFRHLDSAPAAPAAPAAPVDLGNFLELKKIIEESPLDSPNFKLAIKNYFDSHRKFLISDDYEVIYLCDTYASISDYHADRIYSSLQKTKKKKVLLIIDSGGGSIEPAYLISKCCRNHGSDKFCVVVPRRAKSAATLIALGASEIHMGEMSELGPIDPQMNGLPALGLQNAMERLSELATKYPGASNMLAQFLIAQLPLTVLGYFERVIESSAQYAERLLVGHPNVKEIANRLVHEYKNHSFVINREEAAEILGADRIKSESNEYEFGNIVHTLINDANLILNQQGKYMTFIGKEYYEIFTRPLPK